MTLSGCQLQLLLDVDPPAVELLRDGDRQDAVLEVGVDGGDVDGLGEDEGAREAAVAPFDALEPFALRLARPALAAQRQLAVLDLDLDVVLLRGRRPRR